MKKKFLSLALALLMVAGATINSLAFCKEEPTLNLGEPIGTLAESESEGMAAVSATQAASSSGLPFSMTAKGVSGLLTTYNSQGKNFTGGAFDGFKSEGLLIKGTVTHTLGYNVKVGACYYVVSEDTFYSVVPQYFRSGVSESAFIPKLAGGYLNFHNMNTYYGHITNYNGAGKVSGTLSFSVSSN